jgi:hypothetical protein
MPNRIEIIGFGVSILNLILAAISIARALIANSKFLAYLKNNHYEQWNYFLGEDITDQFKHILFTSLSSENSYYYFVFRSKQDFGDSQIKDHKRRIRYAAYGFLVYAVAAFIAFGMTGWLLSQMAQSN